MYPARWRAEESGRDGIELAARFAGRPGYARLHATALRFQGTALTRLGDYRAAQPLMDESVDRLRAIAESFELAQSLHARAVLGVQWGTRPPGLSLPGRG